MSAIVKRLCIGTLAALALVVAPAAAQAASHPFLMVAATGTAGQGESRLFDNPCGVALDSQAHLYVSDYQGRAVDLFKTEPVPELNPSSLSISYMGQLTQGDAVNWGCELALDAAGSLFANDYHQGAVKYVPSAYPFISAPTYASPATIDPDPATGVAVDPVTDRVYVAHRTYVAAYEPDPAPGELPVATIALGTLGDGYGLAVSGFAATAGYLYVADAGDDTVKVYDPATDPLNPVQVIDGAGTPQEGFNDLTDSDLAVDDSTGQLFVVDNLRPGVEHPAAAVDAFDAAGAFLGQLPRPSVSSPLVSGGPSGIAVDNSAALTRGLIYLTSGDDEESAVYAFCPSAPLSAFLNKICDAPSPTAVLEVTRTGSGEGRVANAVVGIDCGVLCVTELDTGTDVSLFPTPRVHSVFTGWTVSGQPGACPGVGSCKVTVSADTEVTATFTAIPQRTLTVARVGGGGGNVTSSPVGLSCGSACAADFDQGTAVTLTAEAEPGSEFVGWAGGGCSGTGACEVTLGADVAVAANFARVVPAPPIDPIQSPRVLAISVTGSGAGAIVSNPAGIACGTPCSGAYAPGSTVTLTATPDPESRFAGWSGCDVVAATRCTVTLTSSRTVGAVFEEAPPRRSCKKKHRSGGRGRASSSAQRKQGAKCKGKGNGKGKGGRRR